MVADPEVAKGLENVARALAELGADVRNVQLPPLGDFATTTYAILHSHAWAIHRRWLTERPGDYGESGRRRLSIGAFLGGGDLAKAEALRFELVRAVEAALGDHDVLLCAVLMDPPCRIDDKAALDRTLPRQARTPFNLTGHPALAMMAGLSTGGLPLAVQFVGRMFDERTVYRAARSWERAAGTDRMHPPV